MSRLQELVDTVAKIIISYYEQTTSKAIDLKSFLTKSHEELINALDAIIKDATPSGYKDRLSLLQYARHMVNETRPLVLKNTSLSTEEVSLLQKTLVSFVANCGLLLKTNQSNKHSILYDGKTVDIKGCIRGVIGHYSYSVSGSVLFELLFSSNSPFNFPLFPSVEQDKSTLSKIDNMIATLIAEHQSPLIHQEMLIEFKALQIQHERLQKQCEEQTSLVKKAEALAIDHDKLAKELHDKKANQDNELAELNTKLEGKKQRIDSLTSDNASLKETLKQKNEAYQLLEAEVLKLREENSSLRHLTPKESISDLVTRKALPPQVRYGLTPFFALHHPPFYLADQGKDTTPSSPVNE